MSWIGALFRGPGQTGLGRWCVAAMLGLACAGCVRRRLTIRSNPPDALVYVDDQEIGRTPVSTKFTYYGTRKIQLVKDGFETTTVKQRFRPPWYELPPLDFIAENLWPWEVRDERVADFQLQPQRITPPHELRARAEDLRRNARLGFAAPLSPPAAQAAQRPSAGRVGGPAALQEPPRRP